VPYKVGVRLRLDDRREDVVGRIDVVIDGISFVVGRFHRIGCRALLGEMDDRRRFLLLDQAQEAGVVLRHIGVPEADGPPARRLPRRKPDRDRPDRGEAFDFEFYVDLAARQIVDDDHVVAAAREVQRRRPAAEPVAADHEDLHRLHPAAPVSPRRRFAWPEP
jgi:hypothetical protein